jgi:hypothetical protein
MADESTDVATKEQMALCVRHVDENATVFINVSLIISSLSLSSETTSLLVSSWGRYLKTIAFRLALLPRNHVN